MFLQQLKLLSIKHQISYLLLNTNYQNDSKPSSQLLLIMHKYNFLVNISSYMVQRNLQQKSMGSIVLYNLMINLHYLQWMVYFDYNYQKLKNNFKQKLSTILKQYSQNLLLNNWINHFKMLARKIKLNHSKIKEYQLFVKMNHLQLNIMENY